MKDEQAIPKWLYIFTPCTLSTAFFVFAVIDGYVDLPTSKGWSFLEVIYSVPPLIVVIILDVVLRIMLKNKFGLVWLIESIVVALIFLLLAYLSGDI